MNIIESILWDKTTEELSNLCGLVGVKKSGTKAEKIKKLCKFYANENWVKELYEVLNKYEKAYITCVVQNKYHPEDILLENIYEKYNTKKTRYFYGDRYIEKNSKLNLLFINRGSILKEFKDKLEEIIEIPKFEIKATDEKVDEEEFFANIVGRENRVEDFDEFIKFININKIKPTKTKQEMPKSSLIKIHDKLKYRDVLRNEDMLEFKEIRNIEDTTVSYAIMKLLETRLIIGTKGDKFCVKEDFCNKYQKLNKIEKIKYLLESYIEANSLYINECERIQSANFRFSKKRIDLNFARKKLIKYLKKCPVNEWIDMAEYKRQIRIYEYGFLRECIGEVLIKDQYYNAYYNSPSHNEFESPFIDIMFMEYLATMGIVDVVLEQYWDDYGYKSYLEVKYFKITKLGAYVLGMEEIEQNEEIEGQKLEVNSNFEIKIKNEKLKYELYFDRFLKKHSEEPLIYKLDFKGMLRALELGIKIKDIYTFLKENSEGNIPKNVEAQFDEWIKSSKKIKVKTITILEVDRDDFHEIISDNRYENCIDSIRDNVIVLKDSKVTEIKKKLNEVGKFCV